MPIHSEDNLVDVNRNSYQLENGKHIPTPDPRLITCCGICYDGIIPADINPDEIASVLGSDYILIRSDSSLYLLSERDSSKMRLISEDCRMISFYIDGYNSNVLILVGTNYYVIEGDNLLRVEHPDNAPSIDQILLVRQEYIVTKSGSIFYLIKGSRWRLTHLCAPFKAVDVICQRSRGSNINILALDENHQLWIRDNTDNWLQVKSSILSNITIIQFVTMIESGCPINTVNRNAYIVTGDGLPYKIEVEISRDSFVIIHTKVIDTNIPFQLWGTRDPSRNVKSARLTGNIESI